MDKKPIRRALISVYDKSGLIEIAGLLQKNGVKILSTGSTAKQLIEAGINVETVESYTGSAEMLDGRVKTLHPRIHAGILADQTNNKHLEQLKAENIEPFDLVIINLYPFTQTVSSGADFDDCIEQIDIGGPSLLRGAAKNHKSVAVISDPSQYGELEEALSSGGFSQKERAKLAMSVFQKTAEYDSAIAQWLAGELDSDDWRSLFLEKLTDLRYGENPHQRASLYRDKSEGGITNALRHHGKEMSFNNYTDAEAALRAAYDHSEPCVAIIKHTNPCGIAIGKSIEIAYKKALACDPVSAFGGVVASNRKISKEMAKEISNIFTEVLVAPGYDEGTLEILSQKPSIRILEVAGYSVNPEEIKLISGGALIQDIDLIDTDGDSPENWRQVSGSKVSPELLRDLQFAWRSVRAVKSNGILLAKDCASVGVGMGQVNRVDAARLAISRAADRAKGSVAASDAFFPFPDGLQILIDGGVSAIVSPGGSVRDEEIIAAAKKANIPLFFTGIRHFSHS